MAFEGVNDTNYNSTLAITDVINELTVIDPATKIDDTGISQEALYNILYSIITNFNLMNAKLDADGGVAGTDYASLWNLTTLASRGIEPNGIHQADLIACLQQMETNFEGVTAKLDADSGVTAADFALSLNFSFTGLDSIGIKSLEDLIYNLQTMITQFNALLSKLDVDTSPSSSVSSSPSASVSSSVSSSPSASVSSSPSSSPSASVSASPSSSPSAS